MEKRQKTRKWIKLADLNNEGKKGGVEPQILFIERSIAFLEDAGRMAIVLPDGIYGNDRFGFIREFLTQKGRILAIVDVPVETFMPNTSTKTSILVFQKMKDPPSNYPIFMAVAEECGHDRRGNPVAKDDIRGVANAYRQWMLKRDVTY